MLEQIKKALTSENEENVLLEASIQSSEKAVKSIFLDDYRVDLIGAENDPEIKNLLEQIPEYDDDDVDALTDVGAVIENFIPETEGEF